MKARQGVTIKKSILAFFYNTEMRESQQEKQGGIIMSAQQEINRLRGVVRELSEELIFYKEKYLLPELIDRLQKYFGVNDETTLQLYEEMWRQDIINGLLSNTDVKTIVNNDYINDVIVYELGVDLPESEFKRLAEKVKKYGRAYLDDLEIRDNSNNLLTGIAYACINDCVIVRA